MSAIAVIPARGGSRRIPRKNIREFYGKPIIAYSIEAALSTGLFSDVIVSTDDDEIAKIAMRFGAVQLIRPAHLAKDEVGTQAVMAHAMKECPGYDFACCIYPTAPMMTGADLLCGWQRIQKLGTAYVMSVNAEPLFDAGQWYWGRASAFALGIPLISPHTAMMPINKDRVCDINTETDWVRAELMYAAWRKSI